jgi:hypothetical protein
MQKCPKCGRTDDDDTRKFCTFDGGRLLPSDSGDSIGEKPQEGLQEVSEKDVQKLRGEFNEHSQALEAALEDARREGAQPGIITAFVAVSRMLSVVAQLEVITIEEMRRNR